jgi:hypothetical protein
VSIALAFVCGFASALLVAVLIGWQEWRERRKLEYRVDNLYRHFACGEGYLGCNGGPNCPYDHK